MRPTPCKLNVSGEDIFCTARIKTYPNDTQQILVCDRAIFGGTGWEQKDGDHQVAEAPRTRREDPESLMRSVRRARARVRDMALCTDFKYFVTLTLDKAKVDRYDVKEITKKLRVWADNQVRRKGLAYVLVPERHKDGAIHFHGFFNDALPVVDSGTMTCSGWKAPRRPRSARQRAEWARMGAHPVYNLPAWTLGFTTAIELYGTYEAAVSYVCKYIGKDMEPGRPPPDNEKTALPMGKIGGRWYYSGGKLGCPKVEYCDLNLRDVAAMAGAYCFDIPDAGTSFAQVYIKKGEFVNAFHGDGHRKGESPARAGQGD